MAKPEAWLDEGDGKLIAAPHGPNQGTNIRIVIGRRVYERSHQADDGVWVFRYHMTEP